MTYVTNFSFIPKQGTLKGFDQTINIILDDSHERVYSRSQGVDQVVLGLYIIRGDNMWVIKVINCLFNQNLSLFLPFSLSIFLPLYLWNSAVIGEIDEELDKKIDFANVKAEPLNSVVH